MLHYKIQKGNKNLQEPCKEVDTVDEGLEIVDKLQVTLDKKNGIGLAANQIGIQKRVCIIRIPVKDEKGQEHIIGHNFVNPVVTNLEEPIIFSNEGCLSFPNIFIKTLRYNKITIVDLLEPEGRSLEGLAAICAQHEIDHTNGKTMYDNQHKKFTPNSPCPCSSGKKFKKCCQRNIKNFERLTNE